MPTETPTAALLRASIELVKLRRERDQLERTVCVQHLHIEILESRLHRLGSTTDLPALLRPQAE